MFCHILNVCQYPPTDRFVSEVPRGEGVCPELPSCYFKKSGLKPEQIVCIAAKTYAYDLQPVLSFFIDWFLLLKQYMHTVNNLKDLSGYMVSTTPFSPHPIVTQFFFLEATTVVCLLPEIAYAFTSKYEYIHFLTVYADDSIPFLTVVFFPLNNTSSRLTSEPPFHCYIVSVCRDP